MKLAQEIGILCLFLQMKTGNITAPKCALRVNL